MEAVVTKPVEIELSGGLQQGALLLPARENGVGVVVLAGSSGRVDVTRAALFAAQGCAALALRWFGGAGQVPGICEIPLEILHRGNHEACTTRLRSDRSGWDIQRRGGSAADRDPRQPCGWRGYD
jgi:hypothetical protein